MSPKRYLLNPAARSDIRTEIFGLLKPASGGAPALGIVPYRHLECAKLQRIRTMLVMRTKSAGRVKSRMCLMRHHESLIESSFISAPTASRDMLEILTGALAFSGIPVAPWIFRKLSPSRISYPSRTK